MSFFQYTDPSGQNWLVDPDGIQGIIRGAVRAQLTRQRTEVVREDNGLLMPTTWSVSTNWRGFRAEVDTEAARYWREAVERIERNPRILYETLIGLMSDSMADETWYRHQFSDSQRRSMQSIGRNVSNWETVVNVTEFLRDASATVLVVAGALAAAPASAGALAAVGVSGSGMGVGLTSLGVGSVLRGAFTYQDSGNIGSAVMNAGGTFSLGLIGIATPGGATGVGLAGRATAVILSGAAAGGTAGMQALMEGHTMRQAVVTAVGSAGGQLLGGLVGGRLETRGIFAQLTVGAGVDTGAATATSAAVRTVFGPAPSPTSGNVDFIAPPRLRPEEHVRRYAMRPS